MTGELFAKIIDRDDAARWVRDVEQWAKALPTFWASAAFASGPTRAARLKVALPPIPPIPLAELRAEERGLPLDLAFAHEDALAWRLRAVAVEWAAAIVGVES